ncbi:MAG: HlyD family type I secretion periplasmic adaptor subunit [Acidobacteria bacterium]|jgi:HlyD family type I secretion membrane fusion protein|nr:HlyD family type I secretion periplasmic adaptor subunit [Acidobacteriota bacterium]
MADVSLSAPPPASPRGALLRQYLVVGWGIIALVFGGLIAWSVFAPFEGAVLTAGQISVESNQQAVQHLEGGIVREIYVREADAVTAGQKLLSLDATSTSASLQALEARLYGLLGTEARLVAERDGTDTLVLRAGFEAFADRPDMQAVLASQKSLMGARSDNLGTQGTILRQRIDQLNTRIAGMQNEISAKDDQIALVDDEISRFETLMERGQAVITRVLALKRDRARLQGEKDALTSDIAATRVQIGEARSEIARLDQGNTETLLTELRDVQTQISELAEERTALLDRSGRLDITAPRAGRVLGIRAHTVGGVIRPSEPIMYIVPENDRLIAKVRISPVDIDKISVGQTAILRFSAFNQDETPKFTGSVINVSADAFADENTGATFYEAMVEIPDDALASSKFQLVPGMPVEVSLRTESRNVLSYLVKPLMDSVSRTFRE